ncbi:hypothetical protein, partial [Rhizobium sp. Pop5]|uniref:hypothetical protein n=1 Tax=Rhizobium sp. Pop5 TaxID=1223565 RepID=UPI001969E656
RIDSDDKRREGVDQVGRRLPSSLLEPHMHGWVFVIVKRGFRFGKYAAADLRVQPRKPHVLPFLSRKSLFKTLCEIGAGTGFPL